jgi:small neutral amino acid transporter SnatA (MarC family)
MIGPIVLLEIIAVSMGYLVVGILPAIVIGWIAFLIAGSLSRELVRSVAGILERIARKA